MSFFEPRAESHSAAPVGRVRLRVAALISRILIAVLGGYGLSAALSAGLALGLIRWAGVDRGQATVASAMLGFLVYLVLLLAAFGLPGRAGAVPRQLSLRRSMSALHTWAGGVLGGVLFAVFWMGALSVFDREIDRWMMPSTRLGPPAAVSLDAAAGRIAQLAPGQAQWSITLPAERAPTLQLRYEVAGDTVVHHLDPASGALVDPPATLGGTGFIFPFHFSLHLDWQRLGIWLVGLAGMALLALVVSGVVIHAQFFREFFTFRPNKALSRGALDLHTTMGVLALPFHFMMPLSGLIIFFSVFFPGTWQAAYSGDRGAFNREVFGVYQRTKANQSALLGSLDAMAREAARRWGGALPSTVRVRNAGDAASVVEMRRASLHEVSTNRDPIYFDGVTGSVLQHFHDKPAGAVQRFITGIHLVQFEHWTLRWLYFLGGLAGCVLVATGFVFWLEARRVQHVRQGLAGTRVVEALTIGSVTGVIGATFVFFVANRALPDRCGLGVPRERAEVVLFYAAWLASFAHAAVRGRRAWAEQCWAIAGLAVAAVALNWLTTGDHVLRSLQRGVPAVAGMDLLLLFAAAAALAAARRLQRTMILRRAPRAALLERGPPAPPPAAHG